MLTLGQIRTIPSPLTSAVLVDTQARRRIACGLALAATPVAAYHSFAEYDANRLVTLRGLVSRIEWVRIGTGCGAATGDQTVSTSPTSL